MIKDVAYSLVGILLTIWFEFTVLVAEKPNVGVDPIQVFKVQGDLWVAAGSIVLGAFFAAPDATKRANLAICFIALFFSFVLIVGLSALAGQALIAPNSFGWVTSMGGALTVWVPNAVAALLLLLCIHQAQKVGK